jgi:cysteine desulfurase
MTMPIYLDYQATTPCDPRVVDAMMPYFTTIFGNPHSRSHAYGWEAEQAVEEARKEIASIIGADSKEIIFTSGATEANNLAIKGAMDFYKQGGKNHLITCVTEHKCVLDTCRRLESLGMTVTYLPVQPNGIIDLDQLESAIGPHTAMVSIAMVNSEVGVIQPVEEIGAICRRLGVFFHTDAAQGVGKIPVDVQKQSIDLLSLSGHKIYGPKGIGALYVRRKNPRVRLNALLSGGGQERGMRSGTLPTPLCVGLGVACSIAVQEHESEYEKIRLLSQRLLNGIRTQLDDVYLNGDEKRRIPGNLNLSFAYVEGEGLIMGIKDLAVSSGSACTSASLEPSYVLRALGVGDELAHTSIRFGIGRFSTQQDIDQAVETVVREVNRLRSFSPLWEMKQEGIDLKSINWAAH